MSVLLSAGDARSLPLKDGSVHCCVCSPPYWSLRDYGVTGQLGLEKLHDCLGWARAENCGECYVCHMRLVAAELWRVLREDGVMFCNLGDSYATQPAGNSDETMTAKQRSNPGSLQKWGGKSNIPSTLKPKDLVGIPWRVALALQADGWYLRSDIIWSKPNPMPESVTDRPTKSHEYLFLLSKSPRYYFDQDAVREEQGNNTHSKGNKLHPPIEDAGIGHKDWHKYTPDVVVPGGRNIRSVWHIATQPYSNASKRIYRSRRVERDAASDGMKCIVLPNCPVHAGQFDQVAKAFCGVHEDGLLSHIIHTYNHLSQMWLNDFAPIRQQHDGYFSGENSDGFLRQYSPAAINHNNEVHKMGLALGSTAPYIPYAEKADRIDDRLVLLASFVQHLCIFGNNILPVDLDGHLLARTPHRIVSKSSLPVPPECECLFYEDYTTSAEHYATFPEALVEPCIKAGTSERGCCPSCGKPWVRVVEKGFTSHEAETNSTYPDGGAAKRLALIRQASRKNGGEYSNNTTTLGWRPACSCPEADPVPCNVLDPFAGSGTTGVVARRLGRHFIGLDLSYQYLHENARERLGLAALDAWVNGRSDTASAADLPLFAEQQP